MELAEHGIRINTVVPAVVETPIYGAFIKPDEVHEALQGFNDFHLRYSPGNASSGFSGPLFLGHLVAPTPRCGPNDRTRTP